MMQNGWKQLISWNLAENHSANRTFRSRPFFCILWYCALDRFQFRLRNSRHNLRNVRDLSWCKVEFSELFLRHDVFLWKISNTDTRRNADTHKNGHNYDDTNDNFTDWMIHISVAESIRIQIFGYLKIWNWTLPVVTPKCITQIPTWARRTRLVWEDAAVTESSCSILGNPLRVGRRSMEGI